MLFSGDFIGTRFDVYIAHPCFRDIDSALNRCTDNEACRGRGLDHEQACACVTAISTRSCSLSCTATADSLRYERFDEIGEVSYF